MLMDKINECLGYEELFPPESLVGSITVGQQLGRVQPWEPMGYKKFYSLAKQLQAGQFRWWHFLPKMEVVAVSLLSVGCWAGLG